MQVSRELVRTAAVCGLLLVFGAPVAYADGAAAAIRRDTAAAPNPNPNAGAIAAYDAGDYREALRLLRPAAERGDAEAQYYLGLMYEKGDGVRKDKGEMRNWYQRAAEGGHAKAQYKVAVGYAFGLAGLSQSDEDAVKWLRLSAENGYKRAQKILGRAYAEGRFGLPRDREQADYWTKKAAS